MRVHETVSGQQIELPDGRPEVEAFIERIEKMLADPKMTENDMIALGYSRENPILDQTMFPTRGAVTRETLDDPAYHIMIDLLFRKRIVQDNVDVDQLAARYTMTVAEAAARAGVHETAVRQAIQARRLPSWIKGGRYFLQPDSIDSWVVGTRGPKPPVPRPTVIQEGAPLELRFGSAPGISFRVKYAGELEGKTKIDANVTGGRLTGWHRMAVLSGGDGKYRLFILEPGDAENEIVFTQFSVRGRFKIAEKINNAREAREMFTAFRAA